MIASACRRNGSESEKRTERTTVKSVRFPHRGNGPRLSNLYLQSTLFLSIWLVDMNLLLSTNGYFSRGFIDRHGLQGQKLVTIYCLYETMRAAEDYYGISRNIDLEEMVSSALYTCL